MERDLLNKEIRNLELNSKMDFQVSVQPPGIVPANSRRIFVANIEPFKSLPKDIRDGTMAELTRLFSFVSAAGQKGMTISLTDPSNYPEAFSFSDSVVTLVDSALLIQPYLDNALKIQGRNAALFFSQLSPSIPYTNPFANPQHTSLNVDLGGRALHSKHIHRIGAASYAIPYMAATVSLEVALEKAVEMIESSFDVINTKARRKNAPLSYYGTHKALIETSMLSVTENPKDPTKWLYKRELLGLALGRFIAHEARHLYLDPHASDGLGTDSPEVLAAKNNEEFSPVDKRDILNAISRLERTQGNIRVVPTFPLQQRVDFPF